MKEVTYSTLSTRHESISTLAAPVLIHSDGSLAFLLSYDAQNALARIQLLNEELSIQLVDMPSDALVEVVVSANIIQLF